MDETSGKLDICPDASALHSGVLHATGVGKGLFCVGFIVNVRVNGTKTTVLGLFGFPTATDCYLLWL